MSTNKTISGNTPFPQSWFASAYPREKYTTRPKFALHFLIALGQSIKTIQGYIEKYREKLLLADPENHNLTALHLIVMKADETLIESLTLKKEALETKDAFGFTPLHMAALTSEKIFKRFLELKADPTLKTLHGATCQDLRVAAGRDDDVRTLQTLYFEDEITPICSDRLKQLFGDSFVYRDSPLWSSEFFPDLWQTEPEELPITDFAKLYQKFRQNPPKLIVTSCASLKGMSNNFLEIQAKEKIEAGQIFAEYVGERIKIPPHISLMQILNEENITKNVYFGFDMDAKKLGNSVRFFNCGFPNAQVFWHFANGQNRAVFTSVKTIEPGEPILWDYGINVLELTLGVQVILGKDSMEQFFKKLGNNWLQLLKQIALTREELKKVHQLTLEKSVSFTELESPFLFPIHNPTALIYLHFKKLFDYTNLSNEVFTSDLTLFEILRSNSNIPLILTICELLKKIDEKYSDRIAVEEWVFSHLEKIPLTHIVKGLDLISEGKLIKEIDIPSNYDWTTDKDHPFSYSRRLQYLRNYYSQFTDEEIIPTFMNQIRTLPKHHESYQTNYDLLKDRIGQKGLDFFFETISKEK